MMRPWILLISSSVAPFVLSTNLLAATILKCGEDVFKYSDFFGYFPEIQHRVDADWVSWCEGARVFSNLGVKCEEFVEKKIYVTVQHVIDRQDVQRRKTFLEEEYSQYKRCSENGGQYCGFTLVFEGIDLNNNFFENFPSAKKFVEEYSYKVGEEVFRQEATTVATKKLDIIDFFLKKRSVAYDDEAVHEKFSSITSCSDQI